MSNENKDDEVKNLDKGERGEKDNRSTGTEPSTADDPAGDPPPVDPGDLDTPGKNG